MAQIIKRTVRQEKYKWIKYCGSVCTRLKKIVDLMWHNFIGIPKTF